MTELNFYRVTISCDLFEDVIVLAEDEEGATKAAKEAGDDFDLDLNTSSPRIMNPEDEGDRSEIQTEEEMPYGATYDQERPHMTSAEIVNDMVAAKVYRCHPGEGQGTMLGIDPKPIPFPVKDEENET